MRGKKQGEEKGMLEKFTYGADVWRKKLRICIKKYAAKPLCERLMGFYRFCTAVFATLVY